MATRRKSKSTGRKRGVRKASPRKPAPSRKKPAAKRPKSPVRAKAVRGKATPPRKPLSRKGASPPESPIELLAKRIVKLTCDEAALPVVELYSADCISHEPGSGVPARGHAGIRDKERWWNEQQSHTSWTPRTICTSKDAITIEWEAEVHMRDGRIVPFAEVAVHDVRGGKISSERYYYDPRALAPPEDTPEAEPEVAPRLYEDGGSDVDPLDL
jgi:ketosteroid isomerase-like protein